MRWRVYLKIHSPEVIPTVMPWMSNTTNRADAIEDAKLQAGLHGFLVDPKYPPDVHDLME